MTTVMNKWFTCVPDRVPYDPQAAITSLTFRHYNPEEMIGGRRMDEVLPFAVAGWHSVCNPLSDQFGPGTRPMPWEDKNSPDKTAANRREALFEVCQKVGITRYCWHNWDLAAEGETLAQSQKNLGAAVKHLMTLQDMTGIGLGWGTANLFSHPRYRRGAATSPDPRVFRYAAAEVARMLEATLQLGGDNYVTWGGREGYATLWNTKMNLELDNLARFCHMLVAHAKKINFTGQWLEEPKPKEPTKHQYSSDVAACLAFLRKYDLEQHCRGNIEANHATLAGHTFEHELEAASVNNWLGGVDANIGDVLLGWDTDHYPMITDESMVYAMLVILENGGLGDKNGKQKGIINFDAKLRRESTSLDDIFYALVGAMDAWALAAKIAQKIRDDGVWKEIVDQQYAEWDGDIGRKIKADDMTFTHLRLSALKDDTPIEVASGREEQIKRIINSYR